ncbi:MAG: glutaredoxin family protein [Patescibacteria group bacterium]|nr:glutaredoxin family protein [bacterium]MDZ4240664.1 glutaredoxin family protein [Patescibacteria group bacterium]
MKNVTIYSTPTCVYCKMAKEFFKENNVTYTEYDVAADLQKRQEMVEKTGQLGVPVIQVENTVMVGFSKEKLSQALGL